MKAKPIETPPLLLCSHKYVWLERGVTLAELINPQTEGVIKQVLRRKRQRKGKKFFVWMTEKRQFFSLKDAKTYAESTITQLSLFN